MKIQMKLKHETIHQRMEKGMYMMYMKMNTCNIPIFAGDIFDEHLLLLIYPQFLVSCCKTVKVDSAKKIQTATCSRPNSVLRDQSH